MDRGVPDKIEVGSPLHFTLEASLHNVQPRDVHRIPPQCAATVLSADADTGHEYFIDRLDRYHSWLMSLRQLKERWLPQAFSNLQRDLQDRQL